MQRRRLVTRLSALAGVPLGLAGLCLALAGCSPGADYPSLFPAVHDMPPPRADTPLDANQVQQATEDLISDRNHLNAQASGTPSAAPGAPAKKQPPAAASATSKKDAVTSAADSASTETK